MAMTIHKGDPVWDGNFQLFGVDPMNGDSVWYQENPDGSITFRHDQKLDTLLAQNVEAEKETHGKRFGEWRRIGSVPDTIAANSGLDEAWEQKDMKWVKRFFNDPDNKKFRTSRGSV